MPNLEFTSANSPRLGSSRLQGINNQSAAAITPATILGSNLAAWFRADLGTWQNSTLTTQAINDSDPIGGWVDQSGNGHNLLQATSANRATLKLNIVNGTPVVRFNGSTDFLATIAFLALSTSTIVVVVRPTTTTGQQFIIDGIATSNRNSIVLGYSATQYGWYAGVLAEDGSATANAWAILNATFNGASSRMHSNGGSDTLGSVSTASLTGITAGANCVPGAYCPCDIAEIIVATGAQSNTVRSQLDSYCDARYAVY